MNNVDDRMRISFITLERDVPIKSDYKDKDMVLTPTNDIRKRISTQNEKSNKKSKSSYHEWIKEDYVKIFEILRKVTVNEVTSNYKELSRQISGLFNEYLE